MSVARKITTEQVRRMSWGDISRLPQPVKVGKKQMRWDGYQWVNLGPSDGTEPTEITDD